MRRAQRVRLERAYQDLKKSIADFWRDGDHLLKYAPFFVGYVGGGLRTGEPAAGLRAFAFAWERLDQELEALAAFAAGLQILAGDRDEAACDACSPAARCAHAEGLSL